eukprot:Skav222343  [mRNA]  locus=scaffold3497:43835:44173:+ [translate_table: standard]
MRESLAKEEVVNTFVLATFMSRPTSFNCAISVSIMNSSSTCKRAYIIKPTANRIFVSRQLPPTHSPSIAKPDFHFSKTNSSAALKSTGLNTSPCFTPHAILNCRLPCTDPVR